MQYKYCVFMYFLFLFWRVVGGDILCLEPLLFPSGTSEAELPVLTCMGHISGIMETEAGRLQLCDSCTPVFVNDFKQTQ